MGRAPFRIEKLHIRNFRGIDEVELGFVSASDEPGGLVVLAGDNGCGKTAILEAILLVLGRADLLPADTAPLSEQVRFGASDFLIEATIRASDGSSETLAANLATFAAATLEQVKQRSANVEYFSARREPENLGDTPDARGVRSEREARRIAELKRRILSAYLRSLRARQNPVLENPAFERLQGFVRHFMNDDWTLDVIPVSNDPGSGDEVVLRRGELPTDITSIAMAREAGAARTDIPVLLPIDRLSSGQVALFAFAGPLVFRDAPADIIIIDEPEQHMHIQWQRHFIGWLRELSPQSQFIVATHSLEILDSALSYERFILVSRGDPRSKMSADETKQ